MADWSQLKLGIVVTLNSGGPMMTVEALSPANPTGPLPSSTPYVMCSWFRDNLKQKDTFGPETLRIESGS